MGKATPDAVLDAALSEIAEGDTIHVCSGEPANHAGIAAVSLADVTVTPGHGNGDFTIGNGDVSGRKVNIAQQASIPIDSSGTATHIAITDAANTTLKQVTTCTSQALTAGGTVTIPTYDIEFTDPT